MSNNQQQQLEPTATTTAPDNNRRNKHSTTTTTPRRRMIYIMFLTLLPSLLFNIANMQCVVSKSTRSLSDKEAAYLDSPIIKYSHHSTNANSSSNIPNNNKLLPTAAKHPRGPKPYSCGVVLFFHIPSTGGASIANWFRKYTNNNNQRHDHFNSNHTFYQKWTVSIGKNGEFRPNQHKTHEAFIHGINAHIQNLGPNEWRSGQYHLVQPPLNSSEHLWYQWRSTVEAQGCQMINAIMLRDPLNHAMSLYKIINKKNGTREEWMNHLQSPSGTGKWATILDFILYNINGPIGRNPYNATKEQKVLRGIELLQRHFDIVSFNNHTQFKNDVLAYTGWKELGMPHMNVHKKPIEFTKGEVEKLYKLLVRNGDVDFADVVKQRYTGHLSYLSNV